MFTPLLITIGTGSICVRVFGFFRIRAVFGNRGRYPRRPVLMEVEEVIREFAVPDRPAIKRPGYTDKAG